MEGEVYSGYLVFADISGYTSYVAQTELTHSRAVLEELLELLIKRLTTVLTLSKLEGDAVFTADRELRASQGGGHSRREPASSL